MEIEEYKKIRGQKPPKNGSIHKKSVYAHLKSVLKARMGTITHVKEISYDVYLSMTAAEVPVPSLEKLDLMCSTYMRKLMTPKCGAHMERSWENGTWWYYLFPNRNLPERAPGGVIK